MGDILEMPSELNVGVFKDNLLATQLDTQERVASLFSDFNVPDIQHSTIPKDLSTDNILQSTDMPSHLDYLTSTDPKLRELAKSTMDQDSAGNRALTKGFGTPTMVKYQEGQEKFTDGHWWSEAGKTKFGFNPYQTLAQNEDFYHTNVWNKYSTFGQIWRGTGTFAGRTLSKLVTGLVGMVGDLGSMAWNGLEEIVEAGGGPKNNFWADVSDNWLARTMQEADDYTKQQILPTYKSLNYDDKGAFAKLTDANFWQNDLADGAGFLLQFAIPGTLFGKAAVLGKAGKLGRFGRIMSTGVGELSTASRFQKGIGASLEFLTGSRNVGGISAHIFNTTMEAVAETKDGFKSTVDDLMAKGMTKEEAQKKAAENAPSQFGLNMAILSVSNAFENKWFQQSVGNRISPFRSKINAAGLINTKPSSLVGKFFADNKWGNRIYFYGGQGAKASVMEGFWEENAQLAAQRYAAGSYKRRGDDTSSEGKPEKAIGFWSQLLKQTVDSANGKDREAADSIMAGAVIGILGGGLFSKFSGTRGGAVKDKEGNVISSTPRTFLPEGARRKENRENAELVAQVKNAQDAWLSINVMPTNLYKEDGSIDEEKAKQRVDELNEKLGKVASIFGRKINVDELIDHTERENKQFLLFGDYVKAHILNGSADALVNRIKNWGNKTPEELALYGVDEQMQEDVGKWATIAQNMIDEYKNIDSIKYANTSKESVESYFQKERAIKSLIFDYIASKQAALHTSSKYTILKNQSNPFKSVDIFNSYNDLIARQLALQQVISQKDIGQESKTHYQSELDKVNEKIKLRKESLPEYKVGNRSDFVFEPNSDIKTEEDQIVTILGDYMNFQFGEEDFKRAADNFDGFIKEYSNPLTGIQKWNDTVDYWAKEGVRTRIKSLTDLGYTEAEITDMTPEQQQKTIEEKIVKETTIKVETAEAKEVKKEPKEPTLAELKIAAMEVISKFDPNGAMTDIEGGIKSMLDYLIANPNDSTLTDEEKDVLTAYLKAFNEAKKAEVAPSQEKESEPPTTTAGDPVIIINPNDSKFEAPKVETTKGEEQEEEKTDIQEAAEVEDHPRKLLSFSDIRKIGNTFFGYYIKPTANFVNKTIQQLTDNVVDFRELVEVSGATEDRVKQLLTDMYANEAPISNIPDNSVPKSVLDEVRKAFRLHEQALDNETSFKEEAEREGMKIHNNKIDEHVDEGKITGDITITTSNPADLNKDGSLKTVDNKDNNLSRFNFMDNLTSGVLNKEDFKVSLTLSKEENIFGIVSDPQGNVLSFNEDGMPVKNGLPIFFYLDYDMFSTQNIDKRRSDVVKPPFPLAPLTTSPGIAGQNHLLQLRPPLDLHPSFVDKDVITMLKDKIRRTTVTASIDFLTQGMLYRDGVTNSYASIPKDAPTHTAADLLAKGHIRDEKGNIPLEDMFINGTYRRAQRIHFPMFRNIHDKNEGVEVVEFRPVNIGEATNTKGEKIFDSMKTIVDGQPMNLFEAAIQGNLETTRETLMTLQALLRPDKFLVLNLGASVLVVNLKKFKKFVTSDNITAEELRALTTIDDIKNSTMNVTKTLYDNDTEVVMYEGVLDESRDNYSTFVNRNIVTSAKPIIKSSKSEGYARINKRIALTLDENMEKMNKEVNQREQINESPEVTDVTIDEVMPEKDKMNIINKEINPEEEINLDDDFTATEC